MDRENGVRVEGYRCFMVYNFGVRDHYRERCIWDNWNHTAQQYRMKPRFNGIMTIRTNTWVLAYWSPPHYWY